jgi:transposase
LVKPTETDPGKRRPSGQPDFQRENEELRRENERLREENERLREELDRALRAGKRQAAPFSRGEPKPKAKQPGRKPGQRYGKHERRKRPAQVDETIAVPLPAQCECGGAVEWERNEAQYQEDIVVQTVRRRFDIAIGHCRGCQQRIQGRDPRQTSDALGAASVQVGATALSLAALMNKQMGVSLGNTRRILELGCGLKISRGGLSRALARMAAKAEPTYEQLLQQARQSLVNALDETGWKVGGKLQWAHVAVGERTTVYAILAGRGYAQSQELIGAGYGGFLVRDGWAPYRRFQEAFHQTCLAHLLRRCGEMEHTSRGGGEFPRAVSQLLKKALWLRDAHRSGRVSDRGLAGERGKLEAAMDRLLARRLRTAANRKLRRHLETERAHLFTFLYCPGLAATNHEAERAIRVLVMARKIWGGNRTPAGARTQSVWMSVLRSCQQQGKAPLPRLTELLCSAPSVVLDVATDSS